MRCVSQEGAFVMVSTFGATFSEAGTFGAALTARLIPDIPRMQAEASLLVMRGMMSVGLTSAAVGALVLAYYNNAFKADTPQLEGCVLLLSISVVLVFTVAYTLSATFLGMLEMTMHVATQSWCLDFKQNCVDQSFKKKQTSMMACRQQPAL